MREEHVNRLQMRAGHGENMRGAIDQRGRKRLTAKLTDVHAFIFAHLRRIQAGRLAAHRMHAGRSDFDVLAIAEQSAEKPFRHRAAADVSGTDKKRTLFTILRAGRQRDSNLESNKSKSTRVL